MATGKLFDIIFENPRDLERPKEIIMYLDGKNGIHRRDKMEVTVPDPEPIIEPQEPHLVEDLITIEHNNEQIIEHDEIQHNEEIPMENEIDQQPQVQVVRPVDNDEIMVCKTANCNSIWKRDLYPDICLIYCTYCNHFNCFKCNTIHLGQSCRDFQNGENKPKEIKMVFNTKSKDKIIKNIQQVETDSAPLLQNQGAFDCIICYLDVAPREGVKLRNCHHQFCQDCLRGHIENTTTAEIQCPYNDGKDICSEVLQHREIRALLSAEMFEKFLARSVMTVRLQNSFRCKTENCNGFWVYDDDVKTVQCPVCSIYNCHKCKAIHTGLDCRKYQDKIFSETDPVAIATRKLFEELIRQGEAMHCPHCNIIITRNDGCDWVQCNCNLEICWATKGPRWGSKGKGDISGGCKCGGTKGPKCHPKCNYCH